MLTAVSTRCRSFLQTRVRVCLLHFLPKFETIPTRSDRKHPVKTALILHGLFGSRKNWRQFSQTLAASLPHWQFGLVDLRCHGESKGANPPHSIHACAEDLLHLLRSPEGQRHLPHCEAIIGHSFGGKVALSLVDMLAQLSPEARHGISPIRKSLIVDSYIGEIHHEVPGSFKELTVTQMVSTLRSIPMPLPSRKALVDKLLYLGWDRSVALWLTTNLESDHQGYATWSFDLDGCEQLYKSYSSLDMWRTLEASPGGTELHLIRAIRSPRWTPDVVKRVEAIAQRNQLFKHHLVADSGHWIHVDNPQALSKIIIDSLKQ